MSMNNQFMLVSGKKAPLGAFLSDTGCNFSVWAPEATSVYVVLFDEAEKEQARFKLPQKSGGVWYGFIKGIKHGQNYAYSVDGVFDPKNGVCFDKDKLLIDPYAKKLSRPQEWDYQKYLHKNSEFISKSVVIDESFDWQGVKKPDLSRSKVVLYETHVKGFTKLNPNIPEEIRGTYLGMAHPETIKYLKELGVSAIQFMPIYSKMSESRLAENGLSNYWGYNPINYMSPEESYAYKDSVTEFKTMVRELHRAGIAVILDVVYNHTAEGGFGGPNVSFRGFDNRNYYVYERNQEKNVNYQASTNVTGCGNSFNASSEVGLQLILDSLRYWLTKMQVDGFRFDLAVTVARETNNYVFNSFEPHGAFFKACQQDPIISQAILIGEPWDIGPYGYRVGQFPMEWSEQNDRFRDNVRSFWRGDQGKMGEFATRLLGSRDIYNKNFRSINSSVNFVTYHDGFTLEDLVSYNERHNEANGEENRDGTSNNISNNWGEEGPSKNPKILRRRAQVKRNMLATVFLAQGIPHIVAGDEIGRTQKGNNNAYCQDNEISWVDWNLSKEKLDLFKFVKLLINIRLNSEVFTELKLSDDTFAIDDNKKHSVNWYHPNGAPLTDSDWHQPSSQVFVLDIGDRSEKGERWLMLFNASSYDICFHLPEPSKGMKWSAVLDTAESDGMPKSFDDRSGLIPVCSSLCMKLLKQVEIDSKEGSSYSNSVSDKLDIFKNLKEEIVDENEDFTYPMIGFKPPIRRKKKDSAFGFKSTESTSFSKKKVKRVLY
ncbi:MAG: glycogen debranching protein GlgX [Ruminobacter sp.]|nr:glycogen debranching protein GlgX [Ruminobacter sp.]MDY5778545.1 glycogen debranching protein GlgX [Succinivibrionaceae bacterium]